MMWKFLIPYCIGIISATVQADPQILSAEKDTQQSGTSYEVLGIVIHEYNSSLAVDKRGPETCTRTDLRLVSWWMVDLGDVSLVKQVAIQPAPEFIRLRNITIEVSMYWNDSSREMINPQLCHYSAGPSKCERTLLPCIWNIVGRYVRITKTRTAPKMMGLCHVDVLGSFNERAYIVERRDGRRSASCQVQVVRTRGFLDCFLKCSQFFGCTSFNMATGRSVCELVLYTGGGECGEITAEGWVHYLIHNTTS